MVNKWWNEKKKKKNKVIFIKRIERKEIISDEKKCTINNIAERIKKISHYNIFFNMYVGIFLLSHILLGHQQIL